MLFMPGDPLNSGGKSQGCFLDVLGIREDGRVHIADRKISQRDLRRFTR